MPAACYLYDKVSIFPPGVAPYVDRGTEWLAEPLRVAWWRAWDRIDLKHRDAISWGWWWRWAHRLEPVRVQILGGLLPAADGQRHAAYCVANKSWIQFDADLCRGMRDLELQELVAHELGHYALHVLKKNRGGDLEEQDIGRLCKSWGFRVAWLDD